MRSNFLKQKSAMVGDVEDKENKSANQQAEEKAQKEEQDKGYHKEGYIDPKKVPEKELTEEEK